MGRISPDIYNSLLIPKKLSTYEIDTVLAKYLKCHEENKEYSATLVYEDVAGLPLGGPNTIELLATKY